MKKNNSNHCDYKVLLIGNGINRAFKWLSWDRFMEKLSTCEYDYDNEKAKLIKKLPFALQTIVFSNDSVSDGMRQISQELMECNLSKDHSQMIKELASLPFEAILTTNYSYEIETSLNPNFYITQGKKSKFRKSLRKGNKDQEQFGIFKYIEVDDKRIFHIHGEAARVNSMVMGHYYYGKLLHAIQQRIPELLKELANCDENGKEFDPVSWIDYFLLGNVYIVGFGLDPSEMDIWWLINCKKRHFSEYGKIYFYEPNLNDPDKYAIKALAKTLDVDCITKKVGSSKEFKSYYKRTIGNIRREINE